mmetsp:Transcript_71064/g.156819  ORF Transcript_71064/g.156819 Transcript_71064/m.156819 type:complete len:109 (+) Transcript_71064:383-709(+)
MTKALGESTFTTPCIKLALGELRNSEVDLEPVKKAAASELLVRAVPGFCPGESKDARERVSEVTDAVNALELRPTATPSSRPPLSGLPVLAEAEDLCSSSRCRRTEAN